jgi:hypothetical protein
MSDMLERVARAIRAVTMPDAYPAFEDMGPTLRELYMTKARAAIEAMREPTAEMLNAAFGFHYRLGTGLGRAKALADMNAMIDAALKE